MNDPEALVSVYQAANVIEAHLVKNLLLGEGIQATVSEENESFAGLNLAAPDVLVHQRDFAQAESVIEEYNERKIERVEGPQWKCQACGTMNDADYDACDMCDAERPSTG
jgi:rubrerythrin